MISVISSNVPMPPGSATNASASSIIFALRSAIVSTTISSVSSSWATPASMKNCGSTPKAQPPDAITSRAMTPMIPTLLPP